MVTWLKVSRIDPSSCTLMDSGKAIAQLGRVEGIGKGVKQLAPWVRPPSVLVPPLSRALALGQQILDDWAQVVGARVAAVRGSLGG